MADINIVTSVAITLRGCRGLVFVSRDIGYLFYTDSSNDFVYKKTTDGGLTWGSAVAISGAETIVGYDVWYDQWNPGDTGRLIHIWYFGTSGDDIIYRSLNTANDSLLGAVTVFNGATSVAGRGTFCSGTKARGGNLYVIFNIDAFAEHGFYRSTDNGATWASRTDPLEADLDQALLFPGNDADPQDIWMLYYDQSVTTFTFKAHDDSANSNSESSSVKTSFTAGATDLTGQYNWTGAIRHSDGHLIAATWSERDSATGDFQVWDVSTANTFTELTALATNIDDCYYPSMFIDQRADVIYIAYVGKSDGSETLDTTASVYYAKSTDRGTTWSKDNLISATGSDWRGCWTPLSGQRLLAVWQDISSLALMTNNDNSKEFGFPTFNNYQQASARVNAGVVSVTDRMR